MANPWARATEGQISFKSEVLPQVKADVTCLVVTGNRAIATATYTDADGAAQIVVMEAVDNGEPSNATPDLLRFSFLANGGVVLDPANAGCYPPILAPVPVEQGNIVVNDA